MKHLLACVTLSIVSATAHAVPLGFKFEGKVNYIPSGIFAPYYLTSISGTFAYDTDWGSAGGIVPSGDGERQTYLANNEAWHFSLRVGELEFISSPENTAKSPRLVIQDNGTFVDPAIGLIFDEFSYFGNTDDNYTWQVGLGETLIRPEVPGAFQSTSIPFALNLSDFNSKFVIIRGNDSEIRATLSSLWPVSVPEPPTFILCAVGLLGLVLNRRRLST